LTQNQKAAFTFEANYLSNNFNGNINTPMRDLKPTVFADLIAMNALYRPY